MPNWPPYCFIENDRTVGIPSEYADVKLFERNQASQQGPALEGWTLEPILPALGDRAAVFIEREAKTDDPFLLKHSKPFSLFIRSIGNYFDSLRNEMSADARSNPEFQISLFLGRAYYSYLGMLGRLLKAKGLDKQLRPGIGNILFALYREDDVTATEIGAKLGLARSTMARLVDKVRKLGLVTTRPDPDDGRAVRISLTKEARDLMPDCFELANHIEATICRGFTEGERQTFADLLLRATANITEELETLDQASPKTKRNP